MGLSVGRVLHEHNKSIKDARSTSGRSGLAQPQRSISDESDPSVLTIPFLTSIPKEVPES